MNYNDIQSGEWLRINRLYLKMTMKEIAERMHTTKQTIFNCEKENHTSLVIKQLYTLVIRNELQQKGLKAIDI